MRNFELDENDPLKVWIEESGVESPKAGFHLNIINKLSPQPSTIPYEPVISNFVMKIIGGILAAFVMSVLLFVPGTESNLSIWNQLPEFTLPRLSLILPSLAIPKIELGAVFNISIIIFSFMAFFVAILASRRLRYH